MRKQFGLTHGLFALLLMPGLLSLTGCSSDESNDPASNEPQLSAEDREDVADEFGRALADEDEGMLHRWDDASEGGGTLSIEREPTGRQLDDTLIVSHGGIAVTRIRNYFDVNGIWSAVFEAGITASMEQMLSIEGTHTNPSENRSISIQHHDTISVDGLLPFETTRVVNGNGSREVEGEFHSRFRQNTKTFDAGYVWTVSELTFDADREHYPYPMAGEIAVDAEWSSTHTTPGHAVTHEGDAEFRIIFDGTRYAELVFTGGEHFWIDLRNGRPMRARPEGEG